MPFLTGQLLAQGIVGGLCMGGIYVLLGLGLTLILSVMNIMQFAHGEIYMIGAFTVYFLSVMNGVNIYVAIFISMITTAILGLIIERVLLRPIRGKFEAYVCVTIGLSLILQSCIVLLFGLAVKQVPNLWPGSFEVFGLMIAGDRAIAFMISLVLTLALYLFLKRTRYGLAVVASAQNSEGALLQGISPNLTFATVLAIGSGLAAVGGALGGSIYTLDPYMGGLALMKGIAIIVIGGMGSVLGTIIGGLILGIADSLIAVIFGSQIAIAIPLLMVIVVLAIRPRGLFGRD